ncbi:MAG: hypothetical protein NVSMB62_04910 [Acidobacteriaceae bacterium]
MVGGLGHTGGRPAQISGQQAGLATALMQALQHHPGGIAVILESLERNGPADQVRSWAAGRQTTATPEQVQQGLHGTGLIEDTAARAGVTHEVAAAAFAAMLPALIRHLAPADYVPQPSTEVPGDQFFSRML